ncbi:unnamed protein product [Ilex paraguariensis]|uniref:Transposase-associated domain-containing protein n=1 Tax=Ilex paraguariensis TaxID=185542 RepID=A0ABC8TH77_9AQUA
MEFTFSHTEPGKMMRCSCVKCNNVYFQTHDDVETHLYYHGIVKDYITWVFHGEEFELSNDNDDDDEPDEEDENDHDDIQEMIYEHYTAATVNAWEGENSNITGNSQYLIGKQINL